MSLILLSTDSVEVVTSAAVTVDVVASYMDASTADPPVVKGSTSGTQPTAITTATTTTVVSAPAASTLRNVKGMTIRNKHASTACDITVQLDRSASNYEKFKVTLLAGETLEYVEGVGFFVVKSTAKIDVKLRVAGSNYVNATTSFTDITGLTYPVESGKHYGFLACLFATNDATTTGAQIGINGPAMTLIQLADQSVVTTSATAAALSAGQATALDTAVSVQTTGSTTARMLQIGGYFNPSAAGTFALRGKSEVAVAAGLTIKVGSWLRLWEFDN